MDVSGLKEKARQLRLDVLDMVLKAGSGHIGGSFSAADIVAALYYSVMKLDGEDRDLFVLSKGHAAPLIYAVLADKRIVDRRERDRLRAYGSPFQGHPDSNKCPGIDCSTGSLGQGVSVAVGMAYGLKAKGSSAHVYVLTGDGELQEGICWEAFMAASQQMLDNLTVIVDRNRLQLSGCTEDIEALGDLRAKAEAFGFEAEEIDGHDFSAIIPALQRRAEGKPRFIVADTVKGKGVSYMENRYEWHGNLPKGDQIAEAYKELGGRYDG